jgi:hypothetical protein
MPEIINAQTVKDFNFIWMEDAPSQCHIEHFHGAPDRLREYHINSY